MVGKKRHNFIAVVLSEIGYLQMFMSSKVQSKWYLHCFRLLYFSNVFDWSRDRKEESFIARVAQFEWSAIHSFNESITLRIQHKHNISLHYDDSQQQPPFSISSFGLLRSQDLESEHVNSNTNDNNDHLDSIHTKNDIAPGTHEIDADNYNK